MAALSKRDIEMIFRAETDAAQRPVNELTSDIRKLRGTLEELTKSAVKNDKSLDSLAKTTAELDKAQNELANARSLLTQLNSQASALGRAEKAAADAGAKYDDLKARVEGADAPTKKLTASLEAAERRMNANNAKLEEARKNYAEVKTSIESIIGPVDNLQDAFRQVAVAQREVTQGLGAAKQAAADFRQEIAANKGTDTDQIRVQEQTLEAERKNTALAESARKQKQRDDIEALLRGNAALEQQFNDLAIAENRASQVSTFRQMAADSIAATSAVQRVQSTLEGSSTAAQRLAGAIQSVLNPAAAAAQTLEGLERNIDSAVARASAKKLNIGDLAKVNNDLSSIEANLVRVAAEVDRYVAQQSRLDAASGAYDKQAAKVKALGAAEVAADADIEKLTASLKREESALEQLGAELDREARRLKELGDVLNRAGVNTNAIPAEIDRIKNAAQKAAPAISRVSQALSPSGRKGFLGLDVYQVQNLSYQVNDVFTGLASGQPPLQVFTQQIGQIVQIFPGIISGFVSWLPLLAPVAAGLVVLASAAAEANSQIAAMREANKVIESLGSNNGIDAKRYVEIAKAFRDMGASAEEANAATKIFVDEGLNPDVIDDYAVAVRNLADSEGVDLVTATDEVTKAFTRGAAEVLALDEKYHFLSDSQRTSLADAKDTKNEYTEVNKAFTALYNKMQAGANAARGPMKDATNELRAAWRGLIETFADTGAIESANRFIANAIRGFTFLINLAKRVSVVFKGAGEAYSNSGGGILGALAAGSTIGANIGRGDYAAPVTAAWDDTLRQMAASRERFTREQASLADAGAGSGGRQRDVETQRAKDRKDAEKAAKKSAKEAAADAKRRAAEAKALAKQYANEQDQLTSSLSRFTAEALRNQQAPLEQQLAMAKQAVDEQFKALEDRLSEFRDKFGADAKISGMSQADYAVALAAQKAQITSARQLGVIESNVNDLLKARDERLKSIKGEQDAGLLSAQMALDRTAEVTSDMGPLIDVAITRAREFIASLTPSSETLKLLDKFDRIQGQSSPEGKKTIDRAQAKAGISQGDKEINRLFERRAALIDAANNLYNVGAINYTQREDQIRQAFEDTNEEIRAGIVTAYEYVEANKALFPADVYQNAIAQLAVYNTQLAYTDELTHNVKQSAEEAISGGIINMFDTLAQGIANVITGAGSLKDLFGDLGRSALNFAATFAKAIADAIIQLYALRIAKSLVGGFHGGGQVGNYGQGQMKLARNIGMPSLAGVPRYHEGVQGAGLKSNEMLAVLENGENVQTEEQQRLEKNRLKAARKGNSGTGLRQVLAFGDEEVAGAMAGQAGEEVVVTHIRRARGRIRQELGIRD